MASRPPQPNSETLFTPASPAAARSHKRTLLLRGPAAAVSGSQKSVPARLDSEACRARRKVSVIAGKTCQKRERPFMSTTIPRRAVFEARPEALRGAVPGTGMCQACHNSSSYLDGSAVWLTCLSSSKRHVCVTMASFA